MPERHIPSELGYAGSEATEDEGRGRRGGQKLEARIADAAEILTPDF
jgi:hypothetical protein